MQRSTMMKAHTYSKRNTIERTDSTIASVYGMLPPPTNKNTATRLSQIDDMKYFFATAAEQWDHTKSIKRFELPGGESISCVLWNDVFYITGTDIVRSLTFRFHAFGRPITNAKKFEEGIFSDLRNLKPGQDARLEEPKSELLDMLYKNNCIRTQKKQKVFYWYSVPHDRLFLDALERDLKREKVGLEPTTKSVAEPASSLSIDSTQELFDQLRKNMANHSTVQPSSIENKQKKKSPVPNSSLSLNQVVTNNSFLKKDQNWSTSPSTPNPNRASWHSSQSRLERAAALQEKRSRVNSVPASLGQQHQLQLLQHRHHRMSHHSYFTGSNSTSRPRSTTSRHLSSSASSLLSSPSFNDEVSFFQDDASTTTTLTDISKPNLSSTSTNKSSKNEVDYIDPISHGVHQLEITSSLSNLSHNTDSHPILSHTIMPSQSVDVNAMKKTKTIFGNLPLFDGAPTYKQRRRRAASVSTSLLNSQSGIYGGGPERVRRQDKCHIRTASSSNHHLPPQQAAILMNNGSSRLALAATKAGFGFTTNPVPPPLPPPLPPPPPPPSSTSSSSLIPTLMSTTTTTTTFDWTQQQQQEYYCPIPECGHLFKRQDYLERHIQSLHMFLCTLCGKQFHSPENLTQHHRLEHGLHQYDPSRSLSHDGDDNHDGGSTGHQNNRRFNSTTTTYQPNQQQFMNQNENRFFSSPHPSFEDSRSSGLSIGITRTASCSSQCSTLSPMTDLDFEISDIQQMTEQEEDRSSTIKNLASPYTTTTQSNFTIMNELSSSSSNSTFFIKKECCQRMNNMTIEDDFSSSNASSPTYSEKVMSTPLTLLSPFKPIQQEENWMQLQTMNTEQFNNLYDMETMNDNYQSIYASYVDPPYLSDMGFVFNT
ncbi:STE like transcription factor-domain-containing protein [Cokeromyces recurvatus]|uniref:STE like transcription factor-domain-containing protein n=1 Tax=Cokeromyces recurvatus TaxID=90255 RepID=UPI0022208DBA|nr:STE like transcription factor-domain-containing protein [Cokeromyces recurvatus]KAI7901611.1 STE like transcription factor-domain-containing protein [Cokeromyces recurvatus]